MSPNNVFMKKAPFGALCEFLIFTLLVSVALVEL
jgi:hypothetical protein